MLPITEASSSIDGDGDVMMLVAVRAELQYVVGKVEVRKQTKRY